MADNQILFPLQITGLTGLTLQIVSATGNAVPSPLTVSEVSGQAGLYAATMTGAGTSSDPIAYAGLLRQDGDLVGYSTPTFLWDGTDLVYPVTLPEIPTPLDATATQAAAAAAITATPANLGTNAPANWLNAAAFQDGALTAAKFAAGAFDAVWSVATRTLTSIADSAGVATLLGRLTSDRAGYLDKLNVSGTLAHTDNASTFRADVSGLLTTTGYTGSLPANFGALAITEGGQVTTSNPGGGGATAAQIWEYSDRTLTGTQASNLAAIPAIPTNPLLTTDSRLGNLDAAISSRATPANVTDAQTAILNQGNSAWTTATGFSTLTPTDLATALTTYDVAKVADVQVSGGFEAGDRTKLTKLYQRQHLDPSAPVTRTKAGDTVTETFDDVTITHSTNGTDTVTSTRSS